MKQDKMHLINKIFNNEEIRTVWDKDEEKYYISVVDVVGVLTKSTRPRKYWTDLKSKLKEEGNEVSEKIGQLKLKSQDGKYRLTDVWKDNGIDSNLEYAILTNDIYKEWSGMTAKEYKQYKGLRKESLRDNMSDIEIALADIGELTARELAKKHKPIGLEENSKIAKEGGQVVSNTRKDIEARLGESVVTKDNLLSYQYIDEFKQIESK